MRKIVVVLLIFMFVVLPTFAGAVIIDLPDSNGLGFFRDTETMLTWMDVNNYTGMTFNEVAFALQGSGYHIARRAELITLLSSADSNLYDYWASIMGDMPGPSGRAIRGMYDTDLTLNTEGAAFIFEDTSANPTPNWFFSDAYIADRDVTKNDAIGAWIVSDRASSSSSVPEPATMVLLGLGMTGLAHFRKRQLCS